MGLQCIVSGGQTGVDRGALDAALTAGFPCGGWCPEGRRAEDGPIPERYPLTVLAGAGYRQRTVKNLLDSDATVIFYDGVLGGGTKFTYDVCVRERKPVVTIDAAGLVAADAVGVVLHFIAVEGVATLNVAGPRASGWAAGHRYATDVITAVIAAVRAQG